MFQAGAKVDLCASVGTTPLMMSLRSRAPSWLVQLLLRSGADPHRSDEFGRTILHYAARQSNICAIKWFIAENVDLDTLGQGPWKSEPVLQCHLDLCDKHLGSFGDITFVLDTLRALQVLAAGTNHVVKSFFPRQTQTQLVELLGSFILKSTELTKSPGFPSNGPVGEDLQEICDIVHVLIDTLSNPLSLSHLCRVQIRRSLGDDFRRKLRQLNVPLLLQEYLMVYKPAFTFEQDYPSDGGAHQGGTDFTNPVTTSIGCGSSSQ